MCSYLPAAERVAGAGNESAYLLAAVAGPLRRFGRLLKKNSPSFEAQARAAPLFFLKKKKQREPCGMCRFGRIWRRCCWVCRCGRNVHLIYGMRAYKFSHRHLPVAAPHFTQNNSRRRRLSAPDMIKMGRSKKKNPENPTDTQRPSEMNVRNTNTLNEARRRLTGCPSTHRPSGRVALLIAFVKRPLVKCLHCCKSQRCRLFMGLQPPLEAPSVAGTECKCATGRAISLTFNSHELEASGLMATECDESIRHQPRSFFGKKTLCR